MYEPSEVLTNKHFKRFKMPEFEKLYLPQSLRPFTNQVPCGTKEFMADHNRGAVSPLPTLQLDGTDFYLSVKGVGSTVNPFSRQSLGKAEVSSLLKDLPLKERLANCEEFYPPRFLTGELRLRGSPYGGQGLQHAATRLKVSEMADLTSIHGFRAALVKMVLLRHEFQSDKSELQNRCLIFILLSMLTTNV